MPLIKNTLRSYRFVAEVTFKQTFIVLVLMMLGFGGSLTTKCVSMNNQPWMVRPVLIDSIPDELHYYSFIISLDGCDDSCNAIENLFGRICVPNKTEDLNLKAFNMIKWINKLKNTKAYFMWIVNADVNLMVGNKILNKNVIMISAKVRVKN